MDALFNAFKVKFSKLDEMIPKYCTELNANSKVNLYINLEPILKKLVAADIDKYLKVRSEDKSFEMISNIINMAAHYRLFFTKNKIYSKVYLYIGHPFTAEYKNRSVNSEYRRYYEHKYSKEPGTAVLANTLANIIPITKIILEYVEGVYLIESDYIESSLVPLIMSKTSGPNEVNMIVSNDRYDYQYANKGFYIIRPKKDASYIVSKSNLIHILKLEDKIVNDIEVGPHFYPFILSLLGDKYRNIEKIKRIGTGSLLKTIQSAIDSDVIGKGVSNINVLSGIIKEEYRHILLKNFYCTDLDTQFSMLNMKDLYSITNQCTDKFDNVTLKTINDRNFKEHPILLMELTGANNLINVKKKKDIFL